MITKEKWDSLTSGEKLSLMQLMPGIDKLVEKAERTALAEKKRVQSKKEGLTKLANFVIERNVVMLCRCKLCGSITMEVWRMKKVTEKGCLIGEMENFYRVNEDEVENLSSLSWFREIEEKHEKDFERKEHAPKLVELRSTRTCRFCKETLAAAPKASLVRAAISMSYRIVEPKRDIPRNEVLVLDKDMDLGMEEM